jgi:hypothetical protein
MSSPEKIPFLNSLTQPLARALEFAFGCRHKKLSRGFHDRKIAIGSAATAGRLLTIPGRRCQSSIPEDCGRYCAAADARR